MKHYSSGTKLTFGKHRGRTIDEVAQFDPSYVDWMHSNRICDVETVNRKDRGEFMKRKLSKGHAIVFG